MTYVIAYIATMVAFFAIDIVWLTVVAKTFYAKQLGPLLAETPNMGVAIVFYLLYIGGIVFFAVKPALEAESILKGAIYGALFGFFCYATYDLTNLATLKNWPVKMVLVDLVWGTFLTGSCAIIGTWVTLKFSGA